MEDDAKYLLKNAFDKLGFSVRAYTKLVKLGRTIADLEESESILASHVAEAIQYRKLDKNYWNMICKAL
ncbi:magnesium chelatase subunit ChlI family protein [Anaeromicrobium sediminis]|uniref:Mg chelatase-related protein C-terminal domain-containing protein n=1 Tax=Anaeromicrobium sediminis TaxID=1478221 RepID=A0A267MR98_9FIRM|nr:hypothetical protein [Anaeromicrobium sediminis]PAB61293.1 hypothetical protein CCE28_02355 [Anaeromicrobium sediminis]